MIKKLCSALLVVSGLAGCAASGELYNDVSRKQVSIDEKNAKLIFFRTTATLAAAGADARVMVDHANPKYVNYGGFTIYSTTPGPHEISVHLGSESNRCELRVSVNPSEELFFELKPNKDLIMGAAVAGGISAGFASKGIYGVPGAVHQEGVPNCQSYFSMVQVSRENALRDLQVIRESKQ